MIKPKKWAYRFEENGGYDCLYSAYFIEENGRFRISIDAVNFYDPNDEPTWEERHSKNAEAEALAKRIVNLLNKEEEENGN